MLGDIIAGLILVSLPFIVGPIAAHIDAKKHPELYNRNTQTNTGTNTGTNTEEEI